MVALLDACAEADGLDYANSVGDLRLLFAHLVRCDPYRDMLFAEVDGRVIAYGRVWWKEESTGGRIYPFHGFVHPAWRRKGLGTAILCYNEFRLREIAREHRPGGKSFQVWASDREAGAHALFLGAGYRPARYMIEMARRTDVPLREAPLPAGLEVRPVQPVQIRIIWKAREEAYRDHWGYTPATKEDYSRWMASPLFYPGLWKVAWEGNQVAGMVLNRIDQAENAKNRRKRGYTQNVFVLRPWRRRGLARALLTQSIQMFGDLGMEETALGVDTQNPSGALRLYESVGYQETRRHTFYRKALAAKRRPVGCSPAGSSEARAEWNV
jgi:ribosomal protein S18 acetylase RimI-like enzyme